MTKIKKYFNSIKPSEKFWFLFLLGIKISLIILDILIPCNPSFYYKTQFRISEMFDYLSGFTFFLNYLFTCILYDDESLKFKLPTNGIWRFTSISYIGLYILLLISKYVYNFSNKFIEFVENFSENLDNEHKNIK